MMGLEKVTPFNNLPLWVSMLVFWGVPTKADAFLCIVFFRDSSEAHK